MRRSVRSLLGSLCLFAAVFTSPQFAIAQDARGMITGVVTDASGALVPEAVLRAVNTASNVAVTAATNAQGNYTLNHLLPGEYRIYVSKEGFKTFERGVEVRAADRMTLDVQLEIGAASERIVVEAGTPLLEVASSSLGTVIDHRRIQDLPLVHGNPFMLEFLSPGITFNGNIAWTRPFDGPASVASVNGSQTARIEFQLDGVANNWRRSPAYQPSVEFIQEYKVQTTSYDAAQGHSAGGWVDVALKSGANDLHGSAYYYRQDPALNTNLFFNNKAGQPKPDYMFYRTGATAGGPIRRDRTFWFVGYERIRHNLPYPQVYTVPTEAQRNGDFSALLALGSQYQLYDPATTRPAEAGRYSRQPFPGNIIPASRQSGIGKNIVNYYPLPNQPGSRDGGSNFNFGSGIEPDHYYSLTTRIDHTFSDRQRIFGRAVVSKRVDGPYRDWAPDASGNNLYYKNRGAALDYINNLTPQTVLNLRYGYTRFVSQHVLETLGFDITSLGLPDSLRDSIDSRGWIFPRISPAGYSGLMTEQLDGNFSDIHTFYGSVSRTMGSHFLRVGADFRSYLVNNYALGASNGNYTFGSYLSGPLDNSPAPPRGTGIAGLLLGIPDGGGVDVNDSYAARSHFGSVFLQDDWKVTRKLTVNLGLRYEYDGPIAERFNRSVRSFDFAAASPIEPAAVANYARSPIDEIPASQFRVKGGLTFAGVNGQPAELWQAPRRNLMPRIGFAYMLGSQTVLRAGYGVFFDQIGIVSQSPIQIGYSLTTALVPSLDNGVTFRATLANPFPDGLQKPVGARDGLATFLGRGVSFFVPNPRTPYNQRWSFGFQRQFLSNFVLDMNYVGSRGTALQISRQLDSVPNEYLSKLRVRDQATIDHLSQNVANPFYPLLPGTGLAGDTVSRSQLLSPYPQFTSVTTQTNDGYSWYHSLQTRVEKRFDQGYTIMGSWTWSKNMEAVSFLNPMDARPERVISPNDRTHRLVINGIYELPFGMGRRYAAGARGVVGKLIEGWQFDAIYQIQSGDPLGLGDFLFYGDPDNIVLSGGERRPERWFNTDGFERDTRRALASNIRYQSSRFSSLRSDGLNYLDFSLIKKTKITERIRLDIRSEFINALNHTVFEAPDTNPYSANFGVVTAGKQLPRTIQFGTVVRF